MEFNSALVEYSDHSTFNESCDFILLEAHDSRAKEISIIFQFLSYKSITLSESQKAWYSRRCTYVGVHRRIDGSIYHFVDSGFLVAGSCHDVLVVGRNIAAKHRRRLFRLEKEKGKATVLFEVREIT